MMMRHRKCCFAIVNGSSAIFSPASSQGCTTHVQEYSVRHSALHDNLENRRRTRSINIIGQKRKCN